MTKISTNKNNKLCSWDYVRLGAEGLGGLTLAIETIGYFTQAYKNPLALDANYHNFLFVREVAGKEDFPDDELKTFQKIARKPAFKKGVVGAGLIYGGMALGYGLAGENGAFFGTLLGVSISAYLSVQKFNGMLHVGPSILMSGIGALVGGAVYFMERE